MSLKRLSLSPAGRLFLALVCACLISALESPRICSASLVLALLFSVLAGPGPAALRTHLVAGNVFVLFLWLTLPWTVSGTCLFSLGPLEFSEEGLLLSCTIALRCNAILLVVLSLIFPLSPAAAGAGLKRLHVPDRLILLFVLTWRCIQLLREEWHRLQTAAALRGFVMRTSLHTYRTLASMLGYTIISSADRAKRMYEAMQLRGFASSFHSLADNEPAPHETVCCLAVLVPAAALVCADLLLS